MRARTLIWEIPYGKVVPFLAGLVFVKRVFPSLVTFPTFGPGSCKMSVFIELCFNKFEFRS